MNHRSTEPYGTINGMQVYEYDQELPGGGIKVIREWTGDPQRPWRLVPIVPSGTADTPSTKPHE